MTMHTPQAQQTSAHGAFSTCNALAFAARGPLVLWVSYVPSWLWSMCPCRPLSSTPSDTELVPLWVGEHHSPGPVLPTPIV